MKLSLRTVPFALALAVPALAAGPKSGLQPGEMASAFEPSHVTGPDRGTDTCVVCKYPYNPAVQVWVTNDNNANLAPIARLLEAKMAKLNKDRKDKEKFRAFFVFVSNDRAATSARLKRFASDHKLSHIGLTTIKPTDHAIESYSMSLERSVRNTVIAYDDRKVKSNFVNLGSDQASLNRLAAAVDAVAK